MRHVPAFALALSLTACCRHAPSCAPPRGAAPIDTTSTPYEGAYFNDGTLGDFPHEYLYGPDVRMHDVRDLEGLHGAVEVLLRRLPALAREQGATQAYFGAGALRVEGPPRTQAFVSEVLAVLRAAPGVARPEPAP